MSIVRFNYADVNEISIKGKQKVKGLIAQIFILERRPLQRIEYIFCSDAYLLNLNKQYLNHDYFTDILTFDLSEGLEINAEVYISVDTVKSNSIIHEVTLSNEMLRVIFHGALHLVGYNDTKKSEITIMREKEDYYLCLFGVK